MTHDDLIQFYGTQTEVARVIGITSASVSEWQTAGVPDLRQLEFQKITAGKLKADPAIVRKYRRLLEARTA